MAIAQLEACATQDNDRWAALKCLEHLALVEWDAAKQIATDIHAHDDAELALLLTTLIRFGSHDEAVKELKSIGLLAATESASFAAVTAPSLMIEIGRAMRFDTETGAFSNEHDVLLLQLHGLAGEALAGVFFEEIPPTAEEDESGGPYLVRAYVDGKRLSTRAQNFGDWYDVESVVGLLNAALVRRVSPLRYVVVPTSDQTTIVAVAPERATRIQVWHASVLICDCSHRAWKSV